MEEKDKKSLINEIKAELDDLEQQLKQSGDEAKTTYQKKKKRIADLLKSYTSQLEEAGSDRLSEIKEDSLELINLLEADYDISYTDYDTESGKISNAIDSLERKIQTLGSEAKKVKGQLEDDLKRKLGKFKTELDIQKAHFKGTKERALNEYEDWKTNRLKEMEELKEKLEQGKEVAEEKLESFTAEFSKSYDHFKQAFKNLW